MKSSHAFTPCLLMLLSIGMGACAKKKGPDCGKVSAHFIGLVRAEMAKTGDAERIKTANANLPTLQNAILVACEEKNWSRASRDCITQAKTAAETRDNCEPASLATTPLDEAPPGTD